MKIPTLIIIPVIIIILGVKISLLTSSIKD